MASNTHSTLAHSIDWIPAEHHAPQRNKTLHSIRRNKTKQDKATQDKAKQHNTRQRDKTKQGHAAHNDPLIFIFFLLPSAKSLFSHPFQGFASRAFCVDLQLGWYLHDVVIVWMILRWCKWLFSVSHEHVPPNPNVRPRPSVALFLKLQKHWQYAVIMV